ncbi:MAG: aromatic ring-hydroxylating dioxygenase subunit alpha [Gammaproteobacteria bacterium]|nr:aromatic ring-hydroxylating dioxygenase subunit alpha [Gammaproteobacteria bacterium]
MTRLSTAQQQVRTDFLRQVGDGRLDKPTAEGSGLPNLSYTCADFFRLEQQTVFRNNWVFAGFAHRLAAAGDMYPVEVAGQPIVLARADDGIIRAFHNVCRHRGARLVTECRNSGKFICPNHSWSYSLEGKLIARPHFHGGEQHDVNKSDYHRADLVEIRCVTWHDWIFVNISGDAEAFATAIAPISAKLDVYDFDTLGFAEALEFDLKANWKLAIENFIEPYHVFSCHPWLNSFVSMDERAAPTFERKVLSCGYDFKAADPARGGELPWFPDLPLEKQNRGDWFVLFPNFAFEIFPDQVDVFIAWPQAPDRCRETIALYFVGDGASAEKYSDARAHVIQNWNDLNHEDIGVVERMQSGRNSEGFDGGVLSPYWDPVLQQFARLLTESVAEETFPGT